MSFKEHLIDLMYKVVAAPFRLLPIDKNLIVFESYYGKGFEDSPSVIASEIASRNVSNVKLIWLVRDEDAIKTLPTYVMPVKRFTIRELFYLSRASVWVDNCRKSKGIKKRKGQYYIQTWHAGISGKKVEKDVISTLSPGYVQNAIHDSQIADIFLSGSRWTSELYRRAFWYDGEIMEEGLPRNDIFFNPKEEICKKVRDFYNLDDSTRIAIYAPTFRQNGDTSCYNMDYTKALEILSKCWGGKWVLLIRLHPSISTQQTKISYTETILNGSIYPDMNELLITSDLLLSDYSSCMFDAMLINKHVIRYASDVVSYNEERGSYFDEDELPFPLAQSNEELFSAIENYDREREIERQNDFLSRVGSVERGVAAKAISDRILDHIRRREYF